MVPPTLSIAPRLSAHAERAHAMKNCLAVISMVTELLESEACHTDPDRLGRLRRATARLGALLEEDLLDGFQRSRRAPGVQPSCSVEAVVRFVADHVADRAEKARVRVIAQCEGGVIEGDESALSECLLNLMVNAIDASASGGAVFLSTRATRDGNQLWTVRDTGHGIPVDQLYELGRPFASRTRGGWGLGLALVQRTLIDHGGLLHVQSHEGAGTTFSIWLPSDRG
jgi:signal transduction histidine kinase